MRHRTFRLNEWSGRYSELADEFYMPAAWRVQDTKNKQGSLSYDSDIEFGLWNNANTKLADQAFANCYRVYTDLLANGVAKELARIVLPVSMFTEIYVNVDVHNLIHFLGLRQDAHAQLEMREIANAMATIAEDLFPWTFEARKKYKFKLIEEE